MGKKISIKNQIIFNLSATISIIFLLLLVSVSFFVHRFLYSALDSELNSHLNSIAALTEINEKGILEFEENENIQKFYDATKGSFFLIINNKTDEVVFTSLNKKDTKKISATIKQNNAAFTTLHLNNKKIRCIIKNIYPKVDDEYFQNNPQTATHKAGNDISKEHPVLFIVGLPTKNVDNTLMTVFCITTVSLFIGLILILIITRKIIKKNFIPINQLMLEVENISSEKLQNISIPQIHEIGIIARSINALIDRLRQSFEKERRFTADVAHELRTPISEILTTTEVALKYDEGSSQEMFQSLKSVHESTTKIHNLVAALLLLSRCDSEKMKVEKRNINISEIILEQCKKLEMQTKDFNIHINKDIDKNTLIDSDENLFKVIIDNILSNAAEYTLKNGKIEIKVRNIDNDKFQIQVINEPVDVSEEDMKFIFDRFWRKDVARSDIDKHSGLGLSLVKSICELFKYEITATLTDKIFSISISGNLKNV